MAVSIAKRTTIHDCAVYPAKDGIPEQTQACDGVDVSSPALEFETTDIQQMGTFSMPDFTRLSNLELSTTINASDSNAARLGVMGSVAEWVVRWYNTVVEPGNISRLVSYTIYAKGYIHTIPGSDIGPGSEGTGTIAMNCLSLKKTDSDGFVYYDIDRMAKRLVVNGVDLRAEANALI
jgi:hypothetical protein